MFCLLHILSRGVAPGYEQHLGFQPASSVISRHLTLVSALQQRGKAFFRHAAQGCFGVLCPDAFEQAGDNERPSAESAAECGKGIARLEEVARQRNVFHD